VQLRFRRLDGSIVASVANVPAGWSFGAAVRRAEGHAAADVVDWESCAYVVNATQLLRRNTPVTCDELSRRSLPVVEVLVVEGRIRRRLPALRAR
jgi:hypothetical protein